jgi:hypothetical protein
MRRCKIYRYVAATRKKTACFPKVLAKLAFFIYCRKEWRFVKKADWAEHSKKREKTRVGIPCLGVTFQERV